jgi:hypothetical protein
MEHIRLQNVCLYYLFSMSHLPYVHFATSILLLSQPILYLCLITVVTDLPFMFCSGYLLGASGLLVSTRDG